MNNWNRVNGEYHKLPSILYKALSRVVERYIERERQAYEQAAKSDCVDHVYLELHCIDFWLRSLRHTHGGPSWAKDYPMLLRTLGNVNVTPRAARLISEDSLERILEAHRLYPWGIPIDDSDGETQRLEVEALCDHQGSLRSYHPVPGRTCHYEVQVETILSTKTQVTVKATPLAGTYDYDSPGHRIYPIQPDDS